VDLWEFERWDATGYGRRVVSQFNSTIPIVLLVLEQKEYI
jgi:hypothetical protein